MEENYEEPRGGIGDIASEIRNQVYKSIILPLRWPLCVRIIHNRQRHWSVLVQAVLAHEQTYFGWCWASSRSSG